MRRIFSVALLTIAGCGSGAPPPENEYVPAKAAVAPQPRAAPAKASAARAPGPPDGVADMSPSRRRAYDRGFADCSAGRYDPDRYPEAYRIGCAAAHDR